MKRNHGVFHVALKALLKKGNKVLLLRMPVGGKVFYDWPGGRIDNVEMKLPLTKVLAREIREELGPSVKYTIGKPVCQFRRYYKPKNIYIFLTVYEGKFLSGKIKLSHEHTSYEWVDVKKFKLRRDKFFNVEEYTACKKYLVNLQSC